MPPARKFAAEVGAGTRQKKFAVLEGSSARVCLGSRERRVRVRRYGRDRYPGEWWAERKTFR